MLDTDLIEDILLEYIEEYGMLKGFNMKYDKIHYYIFCDLGVITIQFSCINSYTSNNIDIIYNINQKLIKRIKFFDERLNISYNSFLSSILSDYEQVFNFEIIIK